MPEIEIQITGDTDKLVGYTDTLVRVLQGALDDAMQTLLASVHSKVPIRTGNLKASHVIDEPRPFERRLYPDESRAPYAEHVILGTGPHTIEPKDAKALYWPGAGHPVRRVNHPGTTPNDYLKRAVIGTDIEGKVKEYIELFIGGD